jgi:Tfp pilus assembly protein PilF
LLNLGEEALEKAGETDFFAKFGERARRDQRQAEAHYLMALGYAAEGQREKAQKAFGDALQLAQQLALGAYTQSRCTLRIP